MADNSGGAKRTWSQALLGRLLDAALTPGWGRRILVAVSAALVLIALCVMRRGPDYREDPSLLVPRSARLYLETRRLDVLLTETASWPLWNGQRRFTGGDLWNNKLLGDLAGGLGAGVGGLGTRLPMNWLTKTARAAWCVDDGDLPDATAWALYLDMKTPVQALAEITVEPGLEIETLREGGRGSGEQGVYALSGAGSGTVYFGVIGPWLIISSSDKLPSYALDSARKPAFSLGRSGILPAWRRGQDIRGMYDPSRAALFAIPVSSDTIGGWIVPETRRALTVAVEEDGAVALHLDSAVMTERGIGDRLRSALKVVLVVLGLLGLGVILAVAAIIVGWTGWLKAAAIRAGVVPAKEPAPVIPSPAFLEDSGSASRAATEDATPEPEHEPEAQPTEPEGEKPESEKSDGHPNNA